ncbi:ABC transporter ATP-binding protein [Eisenbergiella sp.]
MHELSMYKKGIADTSPVICQTNGLTKKYRDGTALDGVSLTVHKGDIYGLIGENGAGKTTLIKLLAGLLTPTSGTIQLLGAEAPEQINQAQASIGYMIETPAVYADMTAEQNLEVRRLQKGIKDKKSVTDTLALVNLTNNRKKVKHYSLGMKQRLALALALLGQPELLILDEPVNGLDPTGIVALRELLLKLNKEKKVTIIISSHILGELHKLADSYGFIHAGKLIEEITADELDAKTQDIETYFTDMIGGGFFG